ncbi:MAG: hypothetical protein IPM61_12860 [Chlorobi bacterium]|nr:hypothetical protein [Chlorobiota bacterium]
MPNRNHSRQNRQRNLPQSQQPKGSTSGKTAGQTIRRRRKKQSHTPLRSCGKKSGGKPKGIGGQNRKSSCGQNATVSESRNQRGGGINSIQESGCCYASSTIETEASCGGASHRASGCPGSTIIIRTSSRSDQ